MKSLISSALFLMLMTIPSTSHAAKMFVDLPENPVSVGNVSLIKIMINTEGAEINAVEGVISISTAKDVVDISTGGSIFNLWPRKPSLDGNKISFTGGNVSGFYGNTLQVFTIAIKPSSLATISINFQDAISHLNDGKGTIVTTPGQSIQIPVQNSNQEFDELASLISQDNTPPSSFKIELGRDPSLYDGKYFISFFATDEGSGIERYEIIEGDRPSIRSGSTYVLQDQSLSSKVTVRAIDNAGNERVETFDPEIDTGMSAVKIVIIILLLLLAILFFVRRFFIKK